MFAQIGLVFRRTRSRAARRVLAFLPKGSDSHRAIAAPPETREKRHMGFRGDFTMKRLLSLAAFALMLSMASGTLQPAVDPVSAANNNVDQFANVELPPDLGPGAIQVYVPDTGHTLRGYFLDYWRATGAKAVYGDPISEPFASSDGLYSQAFENGVFQFRLELVWTDDPSVTLMNLGDRSLSDRLDNFRTDGRRGGGGGDRRTSSWKGVAPDGATATKASTTAVSGTKLPGIRFPARSTTGIPLMRASTTWAIP